jgi:hypothetical protein
VRYLLFFAFAFVLAHLPQTSPAQEPRKLDAQCISWDQREQFVGFFINLAQKMPLDSLLKKPNLSDRVQKGGALDTPNGSYEARAEVNASGNAVDLIVRSKNEILIKGELRAAWFKELRFPGFWKILVDQEGAKSAYIPFGNRPVTYSDGFVGSELNNEPETWLCAMFGMS